MLKAKDPMFMSSSPSRVRQDGVVVGEHHGKEEAVQPIQDATVAGGNPAGIFRPEGALQRRLAETAELREKAHRHAEADGLAAAEVGEEERPAYRRNDDRPDEPPERPLDGLARADGGRELVASEPP